MRRHLHTHRYIPALDGIRGLAIIAVMFCHGFDGLLDGGFLGVDVFFTLSGFLITAILLNEHEQYGRINLKRFYQRRALRLLPALVLMVGVVTAYGVASASSSRIVLVNAIHSLFYTMNWKLALDYTGLYLPLVHCWSLSAEEQFYLLWPPVLILLLKLKVSPRSIALGLILVSLAVAYRRIYLGSLGAPFERLLYGFDTRSEGLMIGCALAVGIRYELIKERLRKLSTPVVGALLVLMMFWLNAYDGFSTVSGISVAVFCSAGLILKAATEGAAARAGSRPGTTFLENRVLVWAGSVSYGLYLWHVPVLNFLFNHTSESATRVLFLPLTFLIAAASFYIVERPLMRLLSRMREPQEAVEYDPPTPRAAATTWQQQKQPGLVEDERRASERT